MSGEAFGVVALAPAVAGAAVATVAAAAVAGVVIVGGAILVRQGGKLLLACGHELAEQAAENLAMQSRLQNAARQYERELRDRERQQSQQKSEASRAQRAALEQALAERDAAIARLRSGVPSQAIQIDWHVLDAPEWRAPVKHFEPVAHWGERVGATANRLDQVAQELSVYSSGDGRGLFDVAYWERELQEARDRLVKLEGPASERTTAIMLGKERADAAALSQVEALLQAVHSRLIEMRAVAPLRAEQRRSALERIEEARASLAARAGGLAVDQAGAPLDGLEIAAAALGDAVAAFDACEFVAADTGARAVLGHLSRLDEVVTSQRRLNLKHVLDDLKARVEPLREAATLAPRVEAWLRDEAACEKLLAQDVTAAWKQVDGPQGLAAQVDALGRDALAWVQAQQAETILQAAADTLAEMGYDSSASRPPAGATVRSLVGRCGDKKVLVGLSNAGDLTAEFKGYGDTTCGDAYKEFFAGLQKRGVVAAMNSSFSLGEAVDDLVQTLWEAGLDVKVEPGDGKVTVIARGQPEASATLTYDGQVQPTPALTSAWQARIRGAVAEEPSRSLADQQRQRQAERRSQRERVRQRERAW